MNFYYDDPALMNIDTDNEELLNDAYYCYLLDIDSLELV